MTLSNFWSLIASIGLFVCVLAVIHIPSDHQIPRSLENRSRTTEVPIEAPLYLDPPSTLSVPGGLGRSRALGRSYCV